MIRWRDRVSPALAVLAVLFLLIALFDRPVALPVDEAQYHGAGPSVPVNRAAKSGVTFAFDVFDIGGMHQAIADPKPLPSRVPITLHGWAVDPRTLAPARRLLITIDGQAPQAASGYGAARPDVGAIVGVAATNSGFAIAIPTTGLPAGKHVLRVILDESDGKRLVLPVAIPFTTIQGPAKIPS